MKNKYGYTVGDLFKIVEKNNWMDVGSIVKLVRDDNSECPFFELVTGKSKNNGSWFLLYDILEPVHIQEKEVPFEPFTLKVDTLEDFETLKGIMHLHNKVSESSFFGLDWTPEAHTVKAFMMDAFDRMDTHCKGWSKYGKED